MSKNGVYICADIGVNWQGSDQKLNEMTEEAFWSNLDAVKLQWFDQDFLDSGRYAPKLKSVLESMCLSRQFIELYIGRVHAAGMEVVVTPFSMRQLEQMPDSVDGIKIRAADCMRTEMIRKAQSFDRPVYVSVPVVDGYFTKPEDASEEAFFELMSCMMRPNTYMVMCVPKYPPDAKDLHLHRVADFQGFSSHYPDLSVPLMAATLAVNSQMKRAKRRFYLEVHMTMTKDPFLAEEIPDMGVSLDPSELAQLVSGIEILEEAI